jgi:hypothetical protein
VAGPPARAMLRHRRSVQLETALESAPSGLQALSAPSAVAEVLRVPVAPKGSPPLASKRAHHAFHRRVVQCS